MSFLHKLGGLFGKEQEILFEIEMVNITGLIAPDIKRAVQKTCDRVASLYTVKGVTSDVIDLDADLTGFDVSDMSRRYPHQRDAAEWAANKQPPTRFVMLVFTVVE